MRHHIDGDLPGDLVLICLKRFLFDIKYVRRVEAVAGGGHFLVRTLWRYGILIGRLILYRGGHNLLGDIDLGGVGDFVAGVCRVGFGQHVRPLVLVGVKVLPGDFTGFLNRVSVLVLFALINYDSYTVPRILHDALELLRYRVLNGIARHVQLRVLVDVQRPGLLVDSRLGRRLLSCAGTLSDSANLQLAL